MKHEFCDFEFDVVWKLEAPWFVKGMYVFLEVFGKFCANDIDFGAVVKEECDGFVFDEYCSVFESSVLM